MSVGFVMLCHADLDRTAQVARFWGESGAPMVIHVDARVERADYDALRRQLADVPAISFSPRFKCEWGTWSIVRATQVAAEQLLQRHAEPQHIFLVSGSCLPLRPLAELNAFLAENADTDFIESVTTADVEWTVGGIDMERFTLRFPFSWRKHRTLFDGYVNFQRRIKFKRSIPAGLLPHLGSQWWCLTRRTLTDILNDPRRAEFDKYFRRVWIPDESYFQSLARLYSRDIESRSLTLSRFDFRGKPHTFYDDHLPLLRRSNCFVARKIWPKANRLYKEFLTPRPAVNDAEPSTVALDRLFLAAAERRTRGRAGLYMQSRFPKQDHENGKTSAPYSVFHGFTDLFPEFQDWLAGQIPARVHGHIFAQDGVHYANGDKMFAGCLSDSAALRDYNPRSFLTNLIWNGRNERQCYMFSPRDNQSCNWFTATDPNAQISVITGAWAINLLHSTESFAEIRREAARQQQIEVQQVNILRSMYVKAHVRIWTLAEFLDNPKEPIQAILDEINPRSGNNFVNLPQISDLSGFRAFLQNLKNRGMQPRLMGNLSSDTPVTQYPKLRLRRYNQA